MPDATPFLLVFFGGIAGGLARYAVSGFVARRIGETFPWGTLVVNASGALLIGLLAAWLGTHAADSSVWIAAAVGVLGSYTTVSSFSLQTLALARDSEWLLVAQNIMVSLALCLGAAFVGIIAGTMAWG